MDPGLAHGASFEVGGTLYLRAERELHMSLEDFTRGTLFRGAFDFGQT